MIVDNYRFAAHTHSSTLNPADTDASDVFIIIYRRNQHLQRCVRIAFRRRDIFQNRVQERRQIFSHTVGIDGSSAGAAGAEQHRGIQLFIGSVQIHQKLQYLVDYFVYPRIGTVNFVYHNDDPMSQFHSSSQHKTSLRHRSLRSIHQKDYAVDHFQNPFHLAAEVRVAGGIYNIDFYPFIQNRGVFREDGNASFPFQVSRVHHPFLYHLIFVVFTTLLEHLIHQSCFSVVNVGDDGDISQIFSNHAAFLSIIWLFSSTY